jgi:hypothetical protein
MCVKLGQQLLNVCILWKLLKLVVCILLRLLGQVHYYCLLLLLLFNIIM